MKCELKSEKMAEGAAPLIRRNGVRRAALASGKREQPNRLLGPGERTRVPDEAHQQLLESRKEGK